MNKAVRILAPMWLAVGLSATLLGGCQPSIEHHGYMASPGAFDQIREGMAKSEVEGVLGSPSTTASINLQGDSYYYISNTTKSRSFLTPKETTREVIAIRFDASDRVTSFAQYGLEDGRVIDLNTRQTPVAGEESSIIKSLFKGLLGT
jgi:outer membrane protein assembly factor BamE (lipoprotein component of BamABCDE complex)